MKNENPRLLSTPVLPVTVKIILVFTVFILVSNLATNYINLLLNNSALLKLTRALLVKDLKALHEFANTQYEIFEYNGNLNASVRALEEKSLLELRNSKAVVLGMKSDGTLFFEASRMEKRGVFDDAEALARIRTDLEKGGAEGFLNFRFGGAGYFGVYRYHPRWEAFLIRAEERKEFAAESGKIFRNVTIVILCLTILCTAIGIGVLRYILRFIRVLTARITRMIETQQMEVVDLKGATNDDITFLGVAFNSLSNTVDNLIGIFRKFVNRDVALKAYQEREIRLEGKVQELTILFSDIKGFTFITETLGADIIKLLNIHYDRVIREILDRNGIIGSIIGDAILAVYGALDVPGENKSLQALQSACKIQEVSETLRQIMTQRKKEIQRRRGRFTPAEEKVYQAVLLQVGVGIDGGDVFYGNIGSHVRMTNTVIGDNVNSASRLEGLTRVYQVPLICSEFVKNDIGKDSGPDGFTFIEIDRVQVKGKTIGKTIYWPVPESLAKTLSERDMEAFASGLKLYYDGDWKEAYARFKRCGLPVAGIFRERTRGHRSPRGWNGIWAMTTK